MFKNNKNLIFVLASLVLFILLAVVYANPVISGKRLMQHDIVFYKGGAEELLQYRANNDKETYWSDAMFGGMPTYQTGAQFRGDVIKKIDDLFLFLPKPANYLFLLFAGFFFLGMVAVRNWKYALLGATFFGLSTYFYIIIAAGHNGKVHTIAYFAPLLAGIILVYFRKKYILGFIVTALFAGLQICANHPQMTYYLFLGLGFLFLSELIRAFKGKIEWKHFLISSGLVGLAVLIGVGMNSQRIMANAEYVKETVRGKQILNTGSHTAGKSGMDKESITMWSYGKLETLNLFIPRLMGGGSQEPGSDKMMEKVQELAQENIKSQQEYEMMMKGFGSLTYWGDQPSTSGPAYQGAVVCFLAVLGFFFAGKKYRYWILGASILTILLAWGSNFSVLTDFFIDYIPMYNKFRAPSSILVVVEFLFPLIAILGLYKFFTDEKLAEEYKKKILICVSIFITSSTLILIISPQYGIKFILIVIFLGLIFLMFRKFFNKELFPNNRKFDAIVILLFIIDANILRYFWQDLSIDFFTYNEKTYLPPFLLDYLVSERVSMFQADAIKAIIYVLITAGALFLGLKKKLNVNIVLLIIGFVSLFDLWTVNRRYLNDDNFVDKTFADYPFQTENSEYLMSKAGNDSFVQSLLQQTEVNKALQTIAEKDKDHYRIFNNILSTFSETNTSYFKSSIGGYHAVKLRRYDDLINKYFSTTDQVKTVRILNMLNTKYFLVGDQQKPEITPNPEANGNAWFVSDIKFVNNPNEELNETGNVDTKTVAVISKDDKAYFNGKNLAKDSTAYLDLKTYQPNELSFESSSKTPQLAVFSEIYYPHGWNVYLDGNKVDYIKTNYLLRALYVPAGKHKIEMKFEPAVIEKGKLFSLISFGLFILLSLVGVYFLFKDKNRLKLKHQQ